MMPSGPQSSTIGTGDSRSRLVTVFRLCGQAAIGPRAVLLQSWSRISAPSSPPPSRKASGAASGPDDTSAFIELVLPSAADPADLASTIVQMRRSPPALGWAMLGRSFAANAPGQGPIPTLRVGT